ncbi:hypothetical protein KCU77_g1724, partial [Aureobasidium melanogenum]
MSTKRKRSTGSLFTPSTVEAPSPTPTIFSSPALLPNFFAQSKGYELQSSPIAWKQSNHQGITQQEEDTTSQTLHSRTRKRYRDGRPEESQIHGMRPIP